MRKPKKQKTDIGRVEIIKLTEANIPFIARRSGMSEDDLVQMRIVRDDREKPSKVRYTVVAD
jgi:hypothetical protein